MAAVEWTVVIPFKGGAQAKSRLAYGGCGRPGLGPRVRGRMARAFLEDTVAAVEGVAAVARIITVAPEPMTPQWSPRVLFVPDPRLGLNAAVSAGLEAACSLDPTTGVAALAADLPCLRPQDLAEALESAASCQLSVVQDHAGSGSTMIAGLPGSVLVPRFGPGSWRAHVGSGHVSLPLPPASTLRTDVDTVEDLDNAALQGLGESTRRVLEDNIYRPYSPSPLAEVSLARHLSHNG